MSELNRNQLVTIGDLEVFKLELVTIIRQILPGSSTTKEKRWVKSSEARKILGISPGKLQMIRDQGLLPFSKIGGNIYYEQEDLYRLFENGKKQKRLR